MSFRIALIIITLLGLTVVAETTDGQDLPLAFEGYGELHMANITGTEYAGLNFHRMVISPKFSTGRYLSLYAEMDIDHALGNYEYEGSMALTQLYLSFNPRPDLEIRIGAMNPFFEPAMYHGEKRPGIESFFAVTTWQEFGVSLVGADSGSLSYELYLMSGLNANEFSAAKNPKIHNFAASARLEYRFISGISVGGSYYFSDLIGISARRQGTLANEGYFHMLESHGSYSDGDVEISIFAGGSRTSRKNGNGNAYKLLTYLETAFNVLPFFTSRNTEKLFLFGRGVWQRRSGENVYSFSPDSEGINVITGITFSPLENLFLKADCQFWSRHNSNRSRQLNVGVGYTF